MCVAPVLESRACVCLCVRRPAACCPACDPDFFECVFGCAACVFRAPVHRSRIGPLASRVTPTCDYDGGEGFGEPSPRRQPLCPLPIGKQELAAPNPNRSKKPAFLRK